MKRYGIIATVLTTFALFSNSISSVWADKLSESLPFAIYGSHAPQPTYERDQAWKDFYEHGALDQPFVQDEDIDAYDWDNQAIVLSERVSKRSVRAPQQFVVALGDRRLYGGTSLDRISQMGVQHPVMYTEHCENRIVLLIRPFHDFGRLPDLANKEWQEIASKDVEDHFKLSGKLRHPLSDPSFEKLRNSVSRIQNLSFHAKPSGLEVTYDLLGSRTGEYTCRESIGWSAGNESKMLGPSYQSVLNAVGQPMHRKLEFSYADLRLKYQPTTMLKENASAPQKWQITIEIAPKLSDSETGSLDVVNRINLDLLNSYGGQVFKMMERSGAKFSLLRDRKVVELPVDWKAVTP